MNFKEYFLESREQKEVLAFHGTSSNNLQKILKNGLQANPKKRVYDSDSSRNKFDVDVTTYGGVYMAFEPDTAIGAGYKASDKFGGQPLLVVLRVQPKSLHSDEDEYTYFLNDISAHLYSPTRAFPHIWDMYNTLVNGGSEEEINDLLSFAKIWADEKYRRIMSGKGNNPKFRELAEERLALDIFPALVKRHAAYVSPYSWDQYTKDIDLKQPTEDEAEETFRNAIDNFIKKVKRVEHLRTGSTARSISDIGFKGRNKIIAILQRAINDEFPDAEKPFRLVYGDETDVSLFQKLINFGNLQLKSIFSKEGKQIA